MDVYQTAELDFSITTMSARLVLTSIAIPAHLLLRAKNVIQLLSFLQVMESVNRSALKEHTETLLLVCVLLARSPAKLVFPLLSALIASADSSRMTNPV